MLVQGLGGLSSCLFLSLLVPVAHFSFDLRGKKKYYKIENVSKTKRKREKKEKKTCQQPTTKMLFGKYVGIWENISLKFHQEENMNHEDIYSIENHIGKEDEEEKNQQLSMPNRM